jgi:hypothetical protein
MRAFVIAAFFPAALRLAAVSAFAIAAFLPATLRFFFARRCFLAAGTFFARFFAIPSSAVNTIAAICMSSKHRTALPTMHQQD